MWTIVTKLNDRFGQSGLIESISDIFTIKDGCFNQRVAIFVVPVD